MLSFLKKLLGRSEKFFDLLDASAKQANESAQILMRLHASIGEPEFDTWLLALSESRRKDKRIAADMTRELCATFITPIEREDIEALASALYKITKTAEKIGARIAISPEHFATEFVGKQLQMLVRATELVISITHQLRKISEMEKIQDAYQQLQTIEGEADKFMLGTLKELYQGDGNAKEIIILADFYELLERATDLCRDAGKIVFQVALKYT